MRRAVRAVAVAVVIGLAVATGACNDDDDSATTPSAERSAFIAQGEQLCSELKAQLDIVFVDFVPTLPRRAAAYRQAIPFGRQFSERFAALMAPPGDEDEIAAARRDYDEGLNRLQEGVEAAEVGDVVGSNAAFTAGFEAFARSDTALRAYGFTVCAEPKTTRGAFGLAEAERQAFAGEKRAYIDQADAICQAGQARLDPIENQTFGGGRVPDLAQWRTFLEAAIPIFEDTLAKVRALPPPPADKPTIDAMVSEFDRALGQARAALGLAGAGDQQGFDQALDAVAESAQRGDAIAHEYGFRHCKEA